MLLPRMVKIRQDLDDPAIDDPVTVVKENINSLGLQNKVKLGDTIAITAGSRGITNISLIIRAVVDECKSIGLSPFIVPAMGSHGGATAEGQLHVLHHFGITEDAMDCPIKSSMEVVRIGSVGEIPVFCDRHAWAADHIAVVGRIKSHTDFEGEIESGLFKMMSIGLGKQEGARQYHRAGQKYGYAHVFPEVGKKVLETSKILFGLAIVENAAQETAILKALLPEDFWEAEKVLLIQAKEMAPHLPFDDLDLLIIDEIGKEISGTGMDPSVIGRPMQQRLPLKPRIRWVFARDLTEGSDGNALGIGMADFTTRRLVEKIDLEWMNVNAITSANPDAAKIPLTLKNDREVLEIALGMIGMTPPDKARVLRIKNTLKLKELEASESLLSEIYDNKYISRLSNACDMRFDDSGNLLPIAVRRLV